MAIFSPEAKASLVAYFKHTPGIRMNPSRLVLWAIGFCAWGASLVVLQSFAILGARSYTQNWPEAAINWAVTAFTISMTILWLIYVIAVIYAIFICIQNLGHWVATQAA